MGVVKRETKFSQIRGMESMRGEGGGKGEATLKLEGETVNERDSDRALGKVGKGSSCDIFC